MPQILVTTDTPGGDHATVLLRERITLPDLESDHFAAQLVERLGWALVDADDLKHASARERREGRAIAWKEEAASPPP